MKHKPARSTDTSPGSRKNLDELEAEVQTSTIERHQDVVAGVEQLLNCYLEGLTNIGQFTITEENQRELVWFFIESRSVNSMRWGFELMTRGYYVQSITLIRLVYEDWLVCWDCIDHPNTVKAILAGNTRMPTFSDMADRLKEPHLSLWKGETQEVEGTYGLLSTFAHPRHRALMVQRDPDSQSLRLGPLYDQV